MTVCGHPTMSNYFTMYKNSSSSNLRLLLWLSLLLFKQLQIGRTQVLFVATPLLQIGSTCPLLYFTTTYTISVYYFANRAQLANAWSTGDTCTVCGHPTMSPTMCNYFIMYKIVAVLASSYHCYYLSNYKLRVHMYCLWPHIKLVWTTLVCVLFVATPMSTISVYYFITWTVCGHSHVYY